MSRSSSGHCFMTRCKHPRYSTVKEFGITVVGNPTPTDPGSDGVACGIVACWTGGPQSTTCLTVG